MYEANRLRQVPFVSAYITCIHIHLVLDFLEPPEYFSIRASLLVCQFGWLINITFTYANISKNRKLILMEIRELVEDMFKFQVIRQPVLETLICDRRTNGKAECGCILIRVQFFLLLNKAQLVCLI